jgi:hypothetical protein
MPSSPPLPGKPEISPDHAGEMAVLDTLASFFATLSDA